MWIAVVMLCSSPIDVRSCDVMVRTEGTFPTFEACSAQVEADVAGMQLPTVYLRHKCFEMRGQSI